MRQNHVEHTFLAENRRLRAVGIYHLNRSTHLTHVLGTRICRGDVSQTKNYDFSTFTVGAARLRNYVNIRCLHDLSDEIIG